MNNLKIEKKGFGFLLLFFFAVFFVMSNGVNAEEITIGGEYETSCINTGEITTCEGLERIEVLPPENAYYYADASYVLSGSLNPGGVVVGISVCVNLSDGSECEATSDFFGGMSFNISVDTFLTTGNPGTADVSWSGYLEGTWSDVYIYANWAGRYESEGPPVSNPPSPFSGFSNGCYGGGEAIFDISWENNGDADRYELWAHLWSTGAWFLVDDNLTGNFYSYYSGRPGTDHYFKLIAVNDYGVYDTDEIPINGNYMCAFPSPDIKADFSDGPITIPYGSSVNITWDSIDADTCDISPTGWTGISGSEPSGNLLSSITYTQICQGWTSTSFPLEESDSVTVNVSLPLPPAGWVRCNDADACTIPFGNSGDITWFSENTDSCSVSPIGWTGTSGGPNSTGPLFSDTTYTLDCDAVDGSNYQDTVVVTVQPPLEPTTSNVSVTEPDYCITGPSITVGWDYSDPLGIPQGSYQVQIDDQGGFSSPEVDSGKITCENCRSYSGGLGVLEFNVTYNARVKVWNSGDVPSGWKKASVCYGYGCQPNGSWKTPSHAYPNVNGSYQFTWSPPNPAIRSPVQFTDNALFDPASNNKQWLWTFVPAGGGSGSSTDQNPVYTFNSDGIYQVTESVRDNVLFPGRYCSLTRAVNLQKSIPVWKEIAPR